MKMMSEETTGTIGSRKPAAATDLNCDAGESFGPWHMGDDEALIPLVTSVNIACGAHAGDPLVMRRTVELASRYGVAIGAHPGYPDLQGFGRRALALTPDEVEASILAQIGALSGMTRAAGVSLQHVKVHGALYNQAADDPLLAAAVARAVRAFDPHLILVARSGSLQSNIARDLGLVVAEEVFIDRGYDRAGHLLPRGEEGSVITDLDAVSSRAADLILRHGLHAADGTWLALRADTLCIHSDTPSAHLLAERLRAALTELGSELLPLGRLALSASSGSTKA
jgi:5-oxoprolinase (ATP-hydrolysing) subunit A